MPTYEYACRDCGHTFETVQRMTDDPLTVCPVCGGTLRKVFAPPAIAFKGSGFYATDHRKDAGSTAGGEGGGEGGTGAKEAKPKGGSKGGSEGGSKGGSDAAGAAASTPAASDGSTAKGSSS
jgi:putative FmdB family regulatory protein